MNILKNFEALFVVTLGLACAATYVTENTAQDATAAQANNVANYSAPATAAAPQNMQVVVVSAKRLSPEQKKQALLAERKAAIVADIATAHTI
jgi:flagellar basal body L-ring protein FlgH